MRDVDCWIEYFIVRGKRRTVNVDVNLLYYIVLIMKASTTRQVPRQIVAVTLVVIIVIIEMDIVKSRLTLNCRGTRKMMITMLRLVWVLSYQPIKQKKNCSLQLIFYFVIYILCSFYFLPNILLRIHFFVIRCVRIFLVFYFLVDFWLL